MIKEDEEDKNIEIEQIEISNCTAEIISISYFGEVTIEFSEQMKTDYNISLLNNVSLIDMYIDPN